MIQYCKVAATLHLGMTQKQDSGYTQWTPLQSDIFIRCRYNTVMTSQS